MTQNCFAVTAYRNDIATLDYKRHLATEKVTKKQASSEGREENFKTTLKLPLTS